MTKDWQKLLQHPLLPKFGVLCIIILGLWLIRPMFNVIMMTLFMTILAYQIANFGKKYLLVPRPLTIVVFYGSIVSSVSFLIYHNWHTMMTHSMALIKNLINFYNANPQHPIKMGNGKVLTSHMQTEILQWLQQSQFSHQLAKLPVLIIKQLPMISHLGLDIVLSFILSLIISLEIPMLKQFNQKFYQSQLPNFFKIGGQLLHQFIQSFAITIDIQLIIAVVNTALTTIGLLLLGYHNLWLLALMVLALSLIPVVGVLISFVPLAIIGFANNGLNTVIMVGLLLITVHAIESYVLNPRIMANRTRLPMAYTFIALIFGEMVLGVWGLLLAVPLLTFMLNFLGVQALPLGSQVCHIE